MCDCYSGGGGVWVLGGLRGERGGGVVLSFFEFFFLLFVGFVFCVVFFCVWRNGTFV